MPKANFNKKSKGAFTLIEIMVVLVIMGFLVALVAPKLAGIVDSAVDTNCDTNQERLRKMINVHVQQQNALPNGLMNMVVVNDVADAAKIPDGDNNDKTDGAEILSADFVERFKPQVHFIDAAEADELIGLGIKGFKYLGKTADAAGTTPTTDELVEEGVSGVMAAGVPVMMAGVGFASTTATSGTWSTGNTLSVTGSTVAEDDATLVSVAVAGAANASTDGDFARMDEAKAIGRILMGVTNDGELVQSGMIEESGTCPGQMRRADHFSWGNYLVVVPRLAATMDRLMDGDGDGAPAAGDLVINAATEAPELHAIALSVDTGEAADGNTIAGRTPNSGYQYFTAQEVKDFTTSCPEGHTWGANADSYGVRVNIN